MKRVFGPIALAALLTAGCATASVSGQRGASAPIGPGISTSHLHAAPMVGPAIEVAPAPAVVPAPRQSPTVTTRSIQGTQQPAASPAGPAAPAVNEQLVPPGQTGTSQCPARAGSGLPCVIQ